MCQPGCMGVSVQMFLLAFLKRDIRLQSGFPWGLERMCSLLRALVRDFL